MSSPIDIDAQEEERQRSPTIHLGSPPQKKSRGGELETSNPFQPLADPNESDTHHLVQMTHAFMQKMEHNLVQKLDLIQAQQKTISDTVDSHSAQLAINSSELTSIQARLQALESCPKASPGAEPSRINELQLEVSSLAQQVQEISRQRAPSAPPPTRTNPSRSEAPRAATLSPIRSRASTSTSPQMAMELEVDWNRLIIGGWHPDTRREKIESEAQDLIKKLGIQESVTDVIVYGRRASACHLILSPQPAAEAKRRMIAWQTQHKDKHTLPSSGKAAWMTPHKSAQKRLKNRATKYAANLLQSILDPANPEHLDIDWNKQILWYRDLRVIAFNKSDLLQPSGKPLHEAQYTDPRSQDELPFFLDLTRLSKLTGKEIPALQQSLRDPKPEWLAHPPGHMHAPAAQHQRYPSDVRPVQILQLASWNVWGKSLFQIADVLSDQVIHFDIIALQEVGGLSQGKLTADGFLAADDPNVQLHAELSDYWIVATDQLSSHHGQAILVDKTFATAVLHTLKGTRFLGALVLHKSGLKLWVFSGHLPHHHQPVSNYSAATYELRQLLQRTQHLPTLVVGDWNATPQQEHMDEQALILTCLEAEAQLKFHLPEQPTWKHRVYDFIGITPAFERCIAPSSLPTYPLIVEGMDSLLPSDHKMITWETTFFQPRQRQGFRHKQHTGRWQVDTQRLQQSLEHHPATPDWPHLCRLARRCQYRLPSRKFRDSPALKELCRARSATTNALHRASLSRHIIATRRAERTQWLSELHASASSGDTSAIAFLKATHKPTTNWSKLIAHSGSLQGAIHNVKNHFQEVFNNTPLPTRTADCSPHIDALLARMNLSEPTPLQAAELNLALTRLKLGKTSGPSGMSNEFLVALGNTSSGQSLLLPLLNAMLIHGDIPPALLTGIACLLPKTPDATAASQIRPILLLEVLQKLFASILMRRLHPHWPPLHVQVGAVPGGQPVEALFAAHHMIALANITDKNPLFLKLDIKGAFDNLRHASVAAFLATLPAQASHEAMRLMQLLLAQTIQFSFLDAHWEVHSSNGTPQGGSHSAGLFARTLDHEIGDLLQQWEDQGHTPLFPPLWLLLFVDDILLCFSGWTQALRLLPSFVERLAKLGLHINPAKSCLVVSQGLRNSTPPHHQLGILHQFPWVEHTHYLRKPFGYNLGSDALQHQAIQLIHAAWGKLKPVLKRCHWRQPATTCKMLDQYVGNAFLWLSPVLYPHQHFRTQVSRVQTTLLIEALNLYIPVLTDEEALHQLLRLRRHVVKRWILHMAPLGSWDMQYLRRYWSFLGHICRQEFRSNHPAKVMLHHLITQHSRKLNRPGPWNTPHSLIRKFWNDMGFEGDYIHVAADRDIWKSLSQSFLHWHGLTMNPNNVEMLMQNPWEHPKRLLHIPVTWIHLVLIGMPAGVFTTVWLDRIEGFSVWTHSEMLQGYEANLASSFQGLCRHLNMLGGPFLLQIAVPNEAMWRTIQSQEVSIQQTLQQSQYASWYQLFPLTASECQHRSLRSCLTYLT